MSSPLLVGIHQPGDTAVHRLPVATKIAPLSDLVLAERRIAVRRWSAASRPVPLQAFRAAA